MSISDRTARILFFLVLVFFTIKASAQDSTVTYNAALLVAGSTGQSPLWLHANKSGKIPLNGTFANGQFGLNKIYNPNNPRVFQWSAGVDMITNYEKRADVFLTDIYLAGKSGPVELLIGQKKILQDWSIPYSRQAHLQYQAMRGQRQEFKFRSQNFYHLGLQMTYWQLKRPIPMEFSVVVALFLGVQIM